MADAILYSSFDVDGPGPRLGMIDTTVNGVVGMYNLLMACLVNGYGAGEHAKPGQGWTLEYAELPTGFTLKAPDGVYYTFCLGSSQTYSYTPTFQVYMAEGISDVTKFPPLGINVRSGDWSTGSGEQVRQWMSLGYYRYNDAQRWFLVARGSQVLISLFMASISSTIGASPTGDSSSNDAGGLIFIGNALLKGVGRPDSGPQNSIVMCGASNQSSWNRENLDPTTEFRGSFLGGGCMTLRDLLSGEVQIGRVPTLHGRSNILSGKTQYKQRVDLFPPDLTLERVPLWQGGCIGYMPGQFYSTYYSHALLSDLFPLLGKSASYGECLLPINVGGEPYYIIPTGYGCIFVSLMEKYWNA